MQSVDPLHLPENKASTSRVHLLDPPLAAVSDFRMNPVAMEALRILLRCPGAAPTNAVVDFGLETSAALEKAPRLHND
jgi:hypothetical protein